MRRFKLTGGRRAKSKALMNTVKKEQSQVLASLTTKLKGLGAAATISAIEREIHGGDTSMQVLRSGVADMRSGATLNRDMATPAGSVMRYREGFSLIAG